MSAVHLHQGLGHRSVIMVGAGAEGREELLEEGDEGLIDEEEEVRNEVVFTLMLLFSMPNMSTFYLDCSSASV